MVTMTSDAQDAAAEADRYEAAKLRWAGRDDAPALVALYGDARRSQPETVSGMLEWLEHGGGLILESAGGELLCALRWREAADGWRVDRVATRQGARGQGYGRWLMTKLEALAIRRNIPTLTLALEAPDDDLLHYYQRMGYQVTKSSAEELTLQKRVGGMWQYKS